MRNLILFIATIVLYAIFPVLFVYYRNEDFIYEGGLALPLLIVSFSTIIIYFILNVLNHKSTNNVIIVIFIAQWFLLYGHIYYYILQTFNIHYSSLRHRYFFPLYTLVFIIPIFKLFKVSFISNKLLKVLFYIGVSLNIQFLVPIYNAVFKAKPNVDKKNCSPPSFLKLPDVYYIIADSYPNSVNLKKYYNYDNSEFVNQLKKLNFNVPENAQSNYPYTYFSIPSSLNMEYINYFEDSVSLAKHNEDFPFTKIYNNKAAKYFKSKGYRYVLFQSAYSQLNNGNYADFYYESKATLNQFYQSLFETSIVSILNIQFYNKQVHEISLNGYSNLLKSTSIKGNKFIFFHSLPPHPPHVFDANGNYSGSQPVVENRYQLKMNYVEQLKFVNITLLKTVRHILNSSTTPPIIIIQGDHGTCSTERYEEEIKWWEASPKKELLKERYGILQAIYLPENYKIDFPKDHTPVNTFRLIINKLFNDSLAILPNKSYFASYRKPYHFREIDWDAVNMPNEKIFLKSLSK